MGEPIEPSAAANEQAVALERRGTTLVITINRPRVKNAINQAATEGIAAAVDMLDGDAELRAGVITGAGGTFCAGMDLKAFAAGESVWLQDRGFAGIVRRPPQKPLIAAVEGYALAGGWELALCADLIVASRQAIFGLPEVTRGLVALGGGLLRLPRRLPHHIVMEISLSGRHVPADELAGYGAINRLVEPGDALDAAVALAQQVAANAPLALAATKRILSTVPDWAGEQAWEEQERIGRPVMRSEDASEGARAFSEKRSPIWGGQ